MDKVTINGWVARDENGSLYLYSDEPWKGPLGWKVDIDVWIEPLDSTKFPNVKWEDEEPTQVTLTIQI